MFYEYSVICSDNMVYYLSKLMIYEVLVYVKFKKKGMIIML